MQALKRIIERVLLGHAATRLLISITVMVPFLLHASGWHQFDFLTELETLAYDSRIRHTMPGGVDQRIVIIDLDERSLNAEGHWPWERDMMADLVNKLFDDYQIRLLGFDLLFAEADDPSAIELVDDLLVSNKLSAEVRDELQDRRYELETDRIFAESLIARDLALGYAFRFEISEGEQTMVGMLPQPLRRREELAGIKVPFPRAIGYVASLPILQSEALTGGFINKPLIGNDGVTRRAATLVSYDGDLYASLGLAMALQALGNPPLQLVFADATGELGGFRSRH